MNIPNKIQICLACFVSFMAGFFAAKAMDTFDPFVLMERKNAQEPKATLMAHYSNYSSSQDFSTESTDYYNATATDSYLRSYEGAAITVKNTPQDHYFAQIVQTAYDRATGPSSHPSTPTPKPVFDIDYWEKKSHLTTKGGLKRQDRILLAEIYGNASSVFEYGLGESTYLANYMQVPRYAGIDSDPVWVDKARTKVNENYRFYFADIGPTKAWGQPKQAKLAKNILDYQLVPLAVELKPFDVYMVDGRWRMASLLASFLHASARGAPHTETRVLIHDCLTTTQGGRTIYKSNDHLLQLEHHSGALLCVYKRKINTTDEQLLQAWHKAADIVGR